VQVTVVDHLEALGENLSARDTYRIQPRTRDGHYARRGTSSHARCAREVAPLSITARVALRGTVALR